MGALEIVGLLASAVLIAARGRCFLGPRRAGTARLLGDVGVDTAPGPCRRHPVG
jgi:P-type Cu+ transporter